MQDGRFFRRHLDFERAGGRAPSLRQKAVGSVAMIGVFALALTFSITLFALVLTLGVVLRGHLWWKTRAVRKTMREHMEARMAGRGAGPRAARGPSCTGGPVIEDEVTRQGKDGHDGAKYERARTPKCKS